jgi:hypothetical protein
MNVDGSASSSLSLSALPESELVTTLIPFFTIRLLELEELIGTLDNVDIDEKDAAGGLSVASFVGGGGGGGRRGDGISTAFSTVVGDAASPQLVELKLLLGGPSLFDGDDEPLRLEGLGDATTISSSTTSLTGMRLLGILSRISSSTASSTGGRFLETANRLKKSGMVLGFPGGGIAACRCSPNYIHVVT